MSEPNEETIEQAEEPECPECGADEGNHLINCSKYKDRDRILPPDCQSDHLPDTKKKVEPQPESELEEHPEDYCHICSNDNIVWYADNDLWNKVMDKREEICCPVCFVQFAEAKGIKPTAWRLSMEGDLPEVDKLRIEKTDLYDKLASAEKEILNLKEYEQKYLDIVTSEPTNKQMEELRKDILSGKVMIVEVEHYEQLTKENQRLREALIFVDSQEEKLKAVCLTSIIRIVKQALKG